MFVWACSETYQFCHSYGQTSKPSAVADHMDYFVVMIRLTCLGLHARRRAEAGAEGRGEDGAVPDRRGLRRPPRRGPDAHAGAQAAAGRLQTVPGVKDHAAVCSSQIWVWWLGKIHKVIIVANAKSQTLDPRECLLWIQNSSQFKLAVHCANTTS